MTAVLLKTFQKPRQLLPQGGGLFLLTPRETFRPLNSTGRGVPLKEWHEE